ncbi:hypothetical protein WA026_019349 [Henosepilachna vigintioctopunctata]|uniref:Uncharacterized protein n=1 Tax=Henosepilachna vigintioctopunctata TaxID=420089 RepID=A0AAW1U1H9_9CUCU
MSISNFLSPLKNTQINQLRQHRSSELQSLLDQLPSVPDHRTAFINKKNAHTFSMADQLTRPVTSKSWRRTEQERDLDVLHYLRDLSIATSSASIGQSSMILTGYTLRGESPGQDDERFGIWVTSGRRANLLTN